MQYFLSLLVYAITCTALALTRRAPTPGQFSQVTDFGDNPTNVGFYIYVPQNLAPKPAIIVAIHFCEGTAEAYYAVTPHAQYAETYGFIVIYPQSPYSDRCWDVSSQRSLSHKGDGNSHSIVNMVIWTTKQYHADTSRVFVTGTSSGAMMTNVLAATHPKLFAAGISYSGVPAGCYYSEANDEDRWNFTCANGQSISASKHWAHIAKQMYPGYEGPRPRMRIYHGSNDTTIYPQNYYETCKQWAGVFGHDYDNPRKVLNDTPLSNWHKTIWGKDLQGIWANGVGHTMEIQGEEDMEWFGFTKCANSKNENCPGVPK
ncbi:alpha/beta hydrolase family esterase [Aspergillus mulundensis]|uniref:Carboxylic ester hydrolase n=1 Tax=Aspergillus mulundensis TaxID=1810919 RepID=A0A3D8SWD3_9EURO|nr:Acetylxylan esterase A [Aspergillus mulundensis]RDW90569.1 Acetylxylan esterase A [Aspergillus mulundensis]